MPSFRTGAVTAILSERAGLQRVEVDGERAYVLTDLVGPVGVGERVVVNTTAVELGLGTGGWHVVHWNLDRDEWRRPGPGHVMKLRYTSLQADTGAAEEDSVGLPSDLGGLPVAVIGLHSQLPLVVAGARWRRPGLRLAYVMTDAGALPLALSDVVADLRATGELATTVTAGQAVGGDHEAVTVASALAWLAGRDDVDAAVVGAGPGVVGTGTTLGTSALDQVGALELAAALGGAPVATLRWSGADGRERHRGLSHHSATVLRLVGRPVEVAVPAGHDDVATAVATVGAGHHRPVTVEVPDPRTLGVEVTTMGRGVADEPVFAACALAAGALVGARAGADGPT